MKTCTACGAEVAEDGRFCDQCGAAIGEASPAAATDVAATVATVETPQEPVAAPAAPIAAPQPPAPVAPPAAAPAPAPPAPPTYAPPAPPTYAPPAPPQAPPTFAPPPPAPVAYAPAPPPPAPAAYAPAPPPPAPAAYTPAAAATPKGNQAIIIAAVAVIVIALGVGAWFLFFNKPATDTGKSNVAQTTTTNTTDSTDATGIVAKLNAAIEAGDATAWDALWDGTAIGEYLQPILVNAAENGAAWSQIVAQVGTEAEAQARLESVLTATMLKDELEKAIFTGKAMFGTVTNTTVNGSTATVSTVDSNNDAIALKLEKRSSGWVVVGFDSDAFINGFVTSFENAVLNP